MLAVVHSRNTPSACLRNTVPADSASSRSMRHGTTSPPLPPTQLSVELRARGIACTATDEGAVLEVPVSRSELPAVHRELVRLGLAVYEVVPVRRTLEEWFLEEIETP